MIWAEKAIRTVKYFKYLKVYEFWLVNFSVWLPILANFVANESNANRQLKNEVYQEKWTLIDFSHFNEAPGMTACDIVWRFQNLKATKRFKGRCYFVSLPCFWVPAKTSFAFRFNGFVSGWLIDRNKLPPFTLLITTFEHRTSNLCVRSAFLPRFFRIALLAIIIIT